MDPNTQPQPTPDTPVSPVPPVIPTAVEGSLGGVTKKNFPLLHLILVLLFLSASAATAFLYLQNQSLNSQLASLTQLSVEVTPTPLTSPEPTAQAGAPDPTSDWKTYTNTQYRYSIKYPSDWRTQVVAAGAGDKEADTNSASVDLFLSTAKDAYPLHRISIEPFELSATQTLDTVVKSFRDWGLENQKESDVKLDSLDVVKIEGVAKPDNFYSSAYIFKIPNSFGGLTFLTRDTLDRKDKDIFDQILSTFKFIEPATPISTQSASPS